MMAAMQIVILQTLAMLEDLQIVCLEYCSTTTRLDSLRSKLVLVGPELGCWDPD